MQDNLNQIEKIYNIKRWKIFRFLPVRDVKIYDNEFKIDNNVEEEELQELEKINEKRE